MTDSMTDALGAAVRSVCKEWKKAKRKADQKDRVSSRELNRMRTSGRNHRTTIKEIAFDVMEAAYQKASGNGRYPATARQIYYAARPEILARHPDIDKLDSPYFTGTLLKDYLEEWEPDWDVVWDARGHFEEPHTRRDKVGLGGIEVHKYLNSRRRGFEIETPELSAWDELIPTRGPNLRYGGALFIEKEGFSPLLNAGQIAEKFDLAIMSTKGMPVSAACDLLGPLGLPVFVVRDFDKAGFSIVNSLQTGTRGSKDHPEEVIDLGFRLDDIEGLEREAVTYNQDSNPGWNLEDNGATEEEIEVLVSEGRSGWWTGERVELNAMTADQFLEWLEKKLVAAGAKKVEPGTDVLTAAYHRAAFLQNAEERFREMCKTYDPSRTGPPYLSENVRCLLEETPTLSWDEVIWRLAREDRWNEHPET